MTSFETFLKTEREKSGLLLARFLQDYLPQYNTLDQTFTTMLDELQSYLLESGKMHRPMLTRLSFELMSGRKANGQEELGSVVMELLHRFILCHDDIVDRDLTRHGKPTLEVLFDGEKKELDFDLPLPQYGQSMAMIAGDLMHSMTFELIMSLTLNNEVKIELARGVSHCLLETAAGWRLETILKQKRIDEVSEAQVKRAMNLVSGQYSVVWPLRIGQLLAGVKLGAWNKDLEIYGREVGLCFQLQDDVLGLMGDERKTGKPVGGDIREGKKTLLLLEMYKRANNKQQMFLRSIMGSSINKNDLEQLRETIIQTKTLEVIKNELKKHSQQAKEILDKMSFGEVNKEAINRLRELSSFLVERSN
jgi:geranylgeranyl diphosphate synthase type I